MRQWPGIVFVLVVIWKVVLALATVQPVPANDSFFYDGPVVNYIAHGKYVNPSLALAFPISSSEVFSAYPPLYQGVLLPWMLIFGTSAFSAVVFHVVLFSIFTTLLYSLLKRLQVPFAGMCLAGAFLFAITFHDRPDSLAHVLGIGALLAWANCCRCGNGPGFARASALSLLSAFLVVLCIATSVQIGAAYAFIVAGCMALQWLFERHRITLASLLIIVVVPVAAVIVVKCGFPLWWNGFVEHARQTPSFTGLRFPETGDLLKVFKAVPGVLLVILAVVVRMLRGDFATLRAGFEAPTRQVAACRGMLFFWSLSAALVTIVASLFFLTANSVAIVAYLQPIAVAIGLAVLIPPSKEASFRAACLALAAAAVLASTRAIGMSTWGLASAGDVSYADARRLADTAVSHAKPGQTIVLSAAYLYDASHHSGLTIVHSDWLGPSRPRGKVVSPDADIRRVKPSLLVLTQFDYYRRYAAILDSLKSRGGDVWVEVHNTGRLSVPDSNQALQRLIQHISWAPVIVELSWADQRM